MKLSTRQKASPCVGTDSGHFYVEYHYIEICGAVQIDDYINKTGIVSTAVRVTRKQLERALEAIKADPCLHLG